MATDADFIIGAGNILNTILNAMRRGQISGFASDVIRDDISELVGTQITQYSRVHLTRVPVRFAVPRAFNLRTGEEIMAVFGIRGDQGTKIPVEFDNIAGTAVPTPSGTPTVSTSSDNIATVQLDTDGTSVDVFPKQPPQENQQFTITYTDGNISFTQDLIIQPDLTATQGHFVTSDATNMPLPT